MLRHAYLLIGVDENSAAESVAFYSFLKQSEVLVTGSTILQGVSPILGEIKFLASSLEEGDTLLLGYSGHGNNLGWSMKDGQLLHYEDLAKALEFFPGELLVLNDTCHGTSLLPHLQAVRFSSNTQFHSSRWDAMGRTKGFLYLEAMWRWFRRKKINGYYQAPLCVERDVTDFEHPEILSWGESLDHRFYFPRG